MPYFGMLLPSNEFFASRAVGASEYWISACEKYYC
jgi:hypothetical protein